MTKYIALILVLAVSACYLPPPTCSFYGQEHKELWASYYATPEAKRTPDLLAYYDGQEIALRKRICGP